MDSKSALKLAPLNLNVLAVCIVVILVTALALLGPTVAKKRTLDQKILAEQKQLDILLQTAPLQQQLDQQEGSLADQAIPKVGKPEKLPPEQTDLIMGVLQALAHRNAVETVAITPQLEAIGVESKDMRIEASFMGPLSSLHAVATGVLMLPYVASLQSLNFTAEQNTLRLNVILSVRTELHDDPHAPPAQDEPTP